MGEVVVLRLRESLKACLELAEAGELVKCEEAVSELRDFLNSVSEGIVNEDDDQGFESTAFEILTEIHQFITSSSSSSPSQEVIDAVSFVLPKLAARFGCASQRCLEMAVSVVDCFICKCSSREMLAILTDALDSPGRMFKLPAYFIPLLTAFPKVFVSFNRNAWRQVKAALPIVLTTLNSHSRIDDDDDDDSAVHVVKLFQIMNCIADSMKTLSLRLEGEESNKMRAMLGLFVLQTLALLSMAMKHRLADSLPLVLHLSQLLSFCGSTYTRLITEAHVNDLKHMALGDDEDNFKACFSHVWLGASLTVIWGTKFNEVATAAEEDLLSLVHELRTSQIKRWEAIGVLKHVFSCVNLPWELKQQTINFLLSILGEKSSMLPDQDADCSEYLTSLYATLQGLQTVLMFAPDEVIRKNAFTALQKLLADLPTSPRFDILKAMIQNSDSASMVAILIDCVRKVMLAEFSKRARAVSGESGSRFWSGDVLKVVELVLRPPGGGPPILPDSCDAISAALTLYRYILITESTGKTNCTGILCRDQLKKIHSEWLLPLRTVMMGISSENNKHGDELATDVTCGLNPIQFALYRCIELTEEQLKH